MAGKQTGYDAAGFRDFKLGEPGSGYENLVGALEFSCYDEKTGKPVVVGQASNIELETRKRWTSSKGGKPVLADEVYGKVAEIRGQEFSARNLRLVHCNIMRWREGADAKSQDECTINMDAVRSRFETGSEAADW